MERNLRNVQNTYNRKPIEASAQKGKDLGIRPNRATAQNAVFAQQVLASAIGSLPYNGTEPSASSGSGSSNNRFSSARMIPSHRKKRLEEVKQIFIRTNTQPSELESKSNLRRNSISGYKLGSVIGKGGFSEVKLGIHTVIGKALNHWAFTI